MATLAMVFAWVGWDRADQVASVVSSLVGIAALGIAAAAAWPLARGGNQRDVRVGKTGRSVARGQGRANTGIKGRAGNIAGRVRAKSTGDAEASGNGEANSGIRLE